MAILGIRKRVKQVIKDVLGLSAPPSAPSTYTPSNNETRQETKAPEKDTTNTSQKQSPFAPQRDSSSEKSSVQETFQQESSKQEESKQEVSKQEANEQEANEQTENDQETRNQEAVNSDFTFAQVEEVLDDMIRPALQNDGGDITLVEIKDNNIYVQLRGACGTCPSSTATMQFGVKNLLNEEFPAMVHLYDITSGSPVIVEDPSMA